MVEILLDCKPIETELLHDLLWEQDNGGVKCQCPTGFSGDGVKNCEGEGYLYFFVSFFSPVPKCRLLNLDNLLLIITS